MKQKKREYFPLYACYDRSGIVRHLEKMAAKGWMLEKLNGFCWQYRRIEPAELRFAVTYFPKAARYQPAPADGLETFRELCAEAGWQLAADNEQLQIFYHTDADAVPLETDPASDLENIHRAMKKGFLSSYWYVLFLLLFQVVLHGGRLLEDPIKQFSSTITLGTVTALIPLIAIIVTELSRYYRWRRRARKAVELGETLPELGSSRWLQLSAWLLVAVEFAVLLLSSVNGSRGMVFTMLFMLVFICLVVVLANGARTAMQKIRVHPWVNLGVTIGIVIAMTVAMMTGLLVWIIRGNSGWFSPSDVVETYEYRGMTWEIYADPIPLMIQDLVETDYADWSTRLTRNSSPLLTHIEAEQRPRMDALEQPDLEYEVVIVKADFLYDLCKNEYIDWLERDHDKRPEEFREEYRPVDPTPWGALEVYQRYGSGEPVNQFLICWPDRIAEIRLDWDWTVTEEMMTVIADGLTAAERE
ncbi:MAG: DUF2812 domain-containing protein [Ruminococcaceae bacterium]|nr:DUF2812 domain-containing protein [Oscillospiraceae bacterium]